jgi:hypothetical protein
MNKKLDGRSLRRSLHLRQFNTKVTEDFYNKIYKLAQEEGVMMREVLEKAVNFYLESKKKTKDEKTLTSPKKTNKVKDIS